MAPVKRSKSPDDLLLQGAMVSFPVGRSLLDGFWRAAQPQRDTLLITVHGMHSNFYSSRLKKEIFRLAESGSADVLIFNNRGSGSDVETERFTDCRVDIGAALAWGRRRGYRRFFLAGHSTGCQKNLYYLDRAGPQDVRGLILLAPCDDFAICRRDLGRQYDARIRQALSLLASGRGGERMPPDARRFTAQRFLSIADRSRTEAALFDYDGPMRAWRRLCVPVLVVFGTREEYACLPVRDMIHRLEDRAKNPDFEAILLRGADHGFHGYEAAVAEEIARWMAGVT